MNRLFIKTAIVPLFLVAQLCIAQAPAGAPAGSTGVCNDGTYYSGASKKGACRGHKGVKEWYGPAAAAPSKSEASKPTAASKPTSVPKTAASTTSSTPGAAPEGATGVCNDGTYYTGATKQGACRGHKGVKDWYGVNSAGDPTKATSRPATPTTPAQAAPTPASSTAPTSHTPAKQSAAPPTTAPSGGSGQVWLNTASNIYHCEGSRYYGKTKAGAYMSEADAKAKGARPDHGKGCQ